VEVTPLLRPQDGAGALLIERLKSLLRLFETLRISELLQRNMHKEDLYSGLGAVAILAILNILLL